MRLDKRIAKFLGRSNPTWQEVWENYKKEPIKPYLPKYCKVHGCELRRERKLYSTQFDEQTGKGVITYQIFLVCPQVYQDTKFGRCYTDNRTGEIEVEPVEPDCDVSPTRTVTISQDLAGEIVRLIQSLHSYYGSSTSRRLDNFGFEKLKEEVY